jgi:hypothetical protein
MGQAEQVWREVDPNVPPRDRGERVRRASRPDAEIEHVDLGPSTSQQREQCLLGRQEVSDPAVALLLAVENQLVIRCDWGHR